MLANPVAALRAVPNLPGLAVCAGVALLVLALVPLLPPVLSAPLVAIAAGLVIGNSPLTSPLLGPGLRFATSTVLRLGIVLLGAQLSLLAVLELGLAGLAVVVAGMTTAVLAGTLAGRALGLSGSLTTLIVVGTAICGNSAILASAPVIRAPERDVSAAVTVITLMGTLAFLTLPVLGVALGLDQPSFGLWAGAAVHDTAQVIATAAVFGAPALAVATVVKLCRNALLGVVLVALGIAMRRRGEAAPQPKGWQRVTTFVPAFVLGFLAMSALNTLGGFDGSLGPLAVRDGLAATSRFLLLVALVAIGARTTLATLRAAGGRPALAGLVAALAIGLTTLAVVLVAGPALAPGA